MDHLASAVQHKDPHALLIEGIAAQAVDDFACPVPACVDAQHRDRAPRGVSQGRSEIQKAKRLARGRRRQQRRQQLGRVHIPRVRLAECGLEPRSTGNVLPNQQPAACGQDLPLGAGQADPGIVRAAALQAIQHWLPVLRAQPGALRGIFGQQLDLALSLVQTLRKHHSRAGGQGLEGRALVVQRLLGQAFGQPPTEATRHQTHQTAKQKRNLGAQRELGMQHDRQLRASVPEGESQALATCRVKR
ncbi:MAG: hypothetical protein U1E77_10920 [Inhella sp.]